VQGVWDPVFGDRSQELVLIGLAMDRAELIAKLDACLLTDEELKPGLPSWQMAANPFPILAEGLTSTEDPSSVTAESGIG